MHYNECAKSIGAEGKLLYKKVGAGDDLQHAQTQCTCVWTGCAQCAIRLLTGSYPSPAVERIGHTNMANRMGDYIPARVATPVPWTTCTSGITDFQCDADTTNQTCVAGLAASI